MYEKQKEFYDIGPAFEELSESELMDTEALGTPTIALSYVGKGILSALASSAVSFTIIVIFD